MKERGDCKANFVATRDGVTIELCTATQGVADLTVGKDTFECQMPGRGRPMPPVVEDPFTECTRDADKRHLRGQARKKFMDECVL